jgi:hypothetical protein
MFKWWYRTWARKPIKRLPNWLEHNILFDLQRYWGADIEQCCSFLFPIFCFYLLEPWNQCIICFQRYFFFHQNLLKLFVKIFALINLIKILTVNRLTNAFGYLDVMIVLIIKTVLSFKFFSIYSQIWLQQT